MDCFRSKSNRLAMAILVALSPSVIMTGPVSAATPTGQAINRSVLDRTRVNDARYPDYHSLNLRADRRFHFSGSNLIAYLSVWSAYDRKNVSSYYWNEVEQRPDILYQWSLIPLIGLEFEF